MWSWRSAGTSNNLFFLHNHYTVTHHWVSIQDVSLDVKCQWKDCDITRYENAKTTAWKKGNIYPQLLKCSLYISNKKLKSLVSADLGWFKFTTYHFTYLKCSPIILPTPTQTSCSYQQSNYFCIFHFIPLAKIPFISSHVLTYVYPLPP